MTIDLAAIPEMQEVDNQIKSSIDAIPESHFSRKITGAFAHNYQKMHGFGVKVSSKEIKKVYESYIQIALDKRKVTPAEMRSFFSQVPLLMLVHYYIDFRYIELINQRIVALGVPVSVFQKRINIDQLKKRKLKFEKVMKEMPKKLKCLRPCRKIEQ